MNLKQDILKVIKYLPMTREEIISVLPSYASSLVNKNLSLLLMENKITSEKGKFSILKKKSKYNNVITEYEGIKFRSKKEKERYCELQILEKAGCIKGLKLQVPFEVAPSVEWGDVKLKAIRYYADFVCTDTVSGQKVIEDSKGKKTALYLLKRSHVIINNPDYRFKES